MDEIKRKNIIRLIDSILGYIWSIPLIYALFGYYLAFQAIDRTET